MVKLEDYLFTPDYGKSEYEKEEEELQERLYILSNEANKRSVPIIIILEGWAGSGKGDLLKTVVKRLDPRKTHIFSFLQEIYTPGNFPFMWKYWRKLPPKGELTVFDGSWYSGITFRRKEKLIDKKEYKNSIRTITNFETMLKDDNYLIFKFFLNIPYEEQRKTLLRAHKKGKTWAITENDWKQSKHYKTYKKLFETYIEETDLPGIPWTIVPAGKSSYTKKFVMETIIHRLEKNFEVDSKKILDMLE